MYEGERSGSIWLRSPDIPATRDRLVLDVYEKYGKKKPMLPFINLKVKAKPKINAITVKKILTLLQ